MSARCIGHMPPTLLRHPRPAVGSTESPATIDLDIRQSLVWAFPLSGRGLSQVELSVGNAEVRSGGGGFTARAGDEQEKYRQCGNVARSRWVVVFRVGEMTGRPVCTWTGS